MMPRPAALALVAVLALAACTATEGDPTAPSSSPQPSDVVASVRPADRPLCMPESATAVTTGPEDDPTLVAYAGSGTRGVVLAPQSDGQVCQWSRQLVRLVDEGYLVATFSWSDVGERSFIDAVDVVRVGTIRLTAHDE